MGNLTDTELRFFGFTILTRVLGDVNAERFIALTLREPRDYTKWRERNMYVGESVHEVAERARAAAKRHDDVHGDYAKLLEGQIDPARETSTEIEGKIKELRQSRQFAFA